MALGTSENPIFLNNASDLCLPSRWSSSRNSSYKEWCEFTLPGSSMPQKRYGNAYHHPSLVCMQSRWTGVYHSSIVIDNKVKQKLFPAHKELLATHLGLSFDCLL